MLGKLLKYEFRSLSKILVPLMFGMLGLAVVTSLVFNLKTQIVDISDHTNRYSDIMNTLFISLSAIVVMVSVLAIAAFAIVVAIILIHRFYQNLFTDEGYLTLTLPVTASQHLNAKLIAASVWTLLSGLVTAAGIFLFVLVGTAPKGQFINTDVIDSFGEAVHQIMPFINSGVWFSVMQMILLVLITIPSTILIYYVAITMGAIIAKKHKILVAIGIYIGISIALYIITTISSAFFMLFAQSIESNDITGSVTTALNLYMLPNLIIQVITGIVCYLVCRSLITKKLNLS